MVVHLFHLRFTSEVPSPNHYCGNLPMATFSTLLISFSSLNRIKWFSHWTKEAEVTGIWGKGNLLPLQRLDVGHRRFLWANSCIVLQKQRIRTTLPELLLQKKLFMIYTVQEAAVVFDVDSVSWRAIINVNYVFPIPTNGHLELSGRCCNFSVNRWVLTSFYPLSPSLSFGLR